MVIQKFRRATPECPFQIVDNTSNCEEMLCIAIGQRRFFFFPRACGSKHQHMDRVEVSGRPVSVEDYTSIDPKVGANIN